MFGKLGLGLGLGGGVSNPIPDTAPEMSFGANSNNFFALAWQGQPSSGDINTLVNGGYLSFTGTITAEYYSGYWRFTITSGAKIVVKQFRKLKRLYIHYNTQCTWVYNKAMPKTLTYLYLHGANIRWDYEGALPTGLTNLYLSGDNIRWDYEGALPTGLTYLYLVGANIRWTYEGSLPIGLSYQLYLSGANINWTGWGVQESFSFNPKIIASGYYYISIGNSPVATEAETAHFLSKINDVALDCSSNPQTLTFKKTTQITSEQYLPILNSLTSKSYTIVLGS